jgi:hypothetical protein
MKKFLHVLILLVTASLCWVEASHAQPSVTSTNTILGFNLNSYGRLRVSKSPYSSGAREVDRMSFIAALSSKDVFDYTEDSDSTRIVAQRTKFKGADSAFVCVIDNEFTKRPPKISVQHILLAWQNTSYVIIRYRVRNDTTIALPLYLSAATLTRPSGTYGGETVTYNAAKQTAYYFRTGQTPHWGIKLLNKSAFSVKIRDWDKYSSDASADAAVDSVRYNMAAGTGFDAGGVVGPNSAIFNVNAGLYNIAPNDTAVVYYAVVFGNSLNDMLAASDDAQARYNSLTTAVEERTPATPTEFTLHQNYPNPFNPTTEIQFNLAEKGAVSLIVHDAMGREFKKLVNGTMTAGAHKINFDATGLPSGVYFYTLRASNFTATRKMLLMR